VPKLKESAIAAICQVGGTFEQRKFHFPDFEVIPTPGHTEGSTCFLWDDRQRRYLFTGDTIYLKDGEWVVAVLSGSERPISSRSL
jgi:glyoxylase-like metal-dependent hydrolase (beta-lactamase superfamily II)